MGILKFLKKMFWTGPEPLKTKGPETFEEAAQFVAQRIDNDTVGNPVYHFSGGMAVRNDLGLWVKDSPLYLHMLQRFGLGHADDTGHLISKAADAIKNGRTYSPDTDVERFKRHWERQGVDPATLKQIGPVRTSNTYLFSQDGTFEEV